jgi:hypothetical protein
MSTSGTKRIPSALNENALRNLIEAAVSRGYYREAVHAEAGHPERGISIDDVLHGLERDDWVFEKSPNYDSEHHSWEYLVKTVDIEGNELHIKIAAFPDDKRFEIITRW